MGFGELRRKGVLGINRRNADYVLRWNDRSLYPRVDDKISTKNLCVAAGIPVPDLLATASHHFEIREMMTRLRELDEFVLKPARGAMGNGIIVIRARDGERFQRAGGAWVNDDDLAYHAASIVSGLYALGGNRDVAVVEERLQVHPSFAAIATEGVPDVRVIVYRGVPVMAMTRLPTRSSGGRANLHQGAIGAGVDLDTGCTIHAVLANRPVAANPDSGESVLGRRIPEFERVVEIGVAAADQTGLGYVGADVVVDARRGPVILELNARPGLAIQIANATGLLPRLRAVDRSWTPNLAAKERIALGREIASGRAQ